MAGSPTWWTDATRHVLERRRAALVWVDRHSRPATPLWRTTDFGHLRLREGRARPWPRYGRAAAYVYFNNDPGGAAITDAVAFAGLARAAGHPTTRAPAR